MKCFNFFVNCQIDVEAPAYVRTARYAAAVWYLDLEMMHTIIIIEYERSPLGRQGRGRKRVGGSLKMIIKTYHAENLQ